MAVWLPPPYVMLSNMALEIERAQASGTIPERVIGNAEDSKLPATDS